MEHGKHSEINLHQRKNQHLWEDPFEVLLVILDFWAEQVQYPDLKWRNISPVPSGTQNIYNKVNIPEMCLLL